MSNRTFTDPLPQDSGYRDDVRFRPTPEHPCEVSIISDDWQTVMRMAEDVSMGGIGVKLSPQEARKAKVPATVTVELRLFGTTVYVRGQAVHRTLAGGKVFHVERELGVHFEPGPQYDTVAPFLERYLQEVCDERERMSA